MTLRLRDELFFPTPFIIDRFFDDDDLDVIETLVESLPRRKRQRTEQSHKDKNTAVENTANTTKIDEVKHTSRNNSRSSLLPLAFFNLDLIESDADYKVHVDLPGVDPADLDISIDNNRFLVIKAERKSVHEETDSKVQVHAVERVYGKTERKLRLPANADVENPESRLKNGVLTIVFGKKEKETVRKIAVQYE